MSIQYVTLNHTVCKDVNRTVVGLLNKKGFCDSPYGALNAGLLAHDLHLDQLPVPDDKGDVGYVFEMAEVAHSSEMAVAWSVITGKMCGSGHPFGIIEEDSTSVVKPFMSVQPRVDAPANSNASNEEFRFHTDNAVLTECLRPRRISLACLVNEANAATGVVSAEAISAGLHPALARVARQHRFVCAAPPSFGAQAACESEPRPLLFDMHDGVHVAFPTYRTRPFDVTDDVAAECLKEIERVAKENASWINLQPGQILHFDNARAMHARQVINALPRRLLRGYWRNSLQELDRLAATEHAYYFSAVRALTATRSGK